MHFTFYIVIFLFSQPWHEREKLKAFKVTDFLNVSREIFILNTYESNFLVEFGTPVGDKFLFLNEAILYSLSLILQAVCDWWGTQG